SSAIQDWTQNGKVARLWDRDKTVWTGADEDKWLGWLDIADRQLEQRSRFEQIANQTRSAGYSDAVLLGMGGSSLCPEVLSITFGKCRKSRNPMASAASAMACVPSADAIPLFRILEWSPER